MLLFIYVIFFGVLLYGYSKRNINPASFLISLYLFSSIASIMLLSGYDSFNVNRIRIEAILYHILVLFLFLFPILKFADFRIINVVFLPIREMLYLAWFIIVFSFFSIGTACTKLFNVISVGDFGVARTMHNAGEFAQNGVSFYELIGGIGVYFVLFSIVLFFYFYVFHPQRKILSVLLLISSTSFIFQNLAVAGRDAIVRWLFSMIFSYLIFRPYIPKKKKKIINYILIVISIPIILFFYLITVDRFDGRDNPILFYVILYLGQSFIYFSYGYDLFYEPTFHGRKVFAFLFPQNEQIGSTNLNEIVYADYYLNTFSTFVGSIYNDIGNIYTLILGIGFFIFALFIFRNKNRISFLTLVLYLFFYEIMMLGVFYYMHGYKSAIKSFLLFFFVVFLLSVIKGKNDSKFNSYEKYRLLINILKKEK